MEEVLDSLTLEQLDEVVDEVHMLRQELLDWLEHLDNDLHEETEYHQHLHDEVVEQVELDETEDDELLEIDELE